MYILSRVVCPACGQPNSMRVSHAPQRTMLVCQTPDCPRPLAAEQLLSEQQGTRHVIRIDGDGYSVKHPLIERLDDALLDCNLANRVAILARRWLRDGRVQSGVRYYASFSSIGSIDLRAVE